MSRAPTPKVLFTLLGATTQLLLCCVEFCTKSPPTPILTCDNTGRGSTVSSPWCLIAHLSRGASRRAAYWHHRGGRFRLGARRRTHERIQLLGNRVVALQGGALGSAATFPVGEPRDVLHEERFGRPRTIFKRGQMTDRLPTREVPQQSGVVASMDSVERPQVVGSLMRGAKGLEGWTGPAATGNLQFG